MRRTRRPENRARRACGIETLGILRRLEGAEGTGRATAFTLLEILVVISILGLLAALLVPSLLGARLQARQKAARAELEQIVLALGLYESKFGDYPPSDLAAWGVRENELNAGNEAMTAALFTTRSGGPFLDLGRFESRLENLDGDEAPRNLTEWIFGDDQLREVTDPWGNPYVYFHHRDYRKPERMASYSITGQEASCQPSRSAKTATFHAPTTYQLWSAGPDQLNQDVAEGSDDIATWK